MTTSTLDGTTPSHSGRFDTGETAPGNRGAGSWMDPSAGQWGREKSVTPAGIRSDDSDVVIPISFPILSELPRVSYVLDIVER